MGENPENKSEPEQKTLEQKPRTSSEWAKLVWDFSWDKKSIKSHIENEFKYAKHFPLT